MKRLVSMLLAMVLLASLIPVALADTSLANGSQAIVTTSSGKLNMRSGASSSYPIIKRLSNGSAVTVVSRVGDWYYVTAGGTTGYVSASYLRSSGTSAPSQSVPPTNNTPADSSQTMLGASAYVATSGGSLNMRSTPDYQGGVVRRLPNGASVTIQEKVNDWYRVSYNGRQGYVLGTYLRVNQSSASSTPSGTASGTGSTTSTSSTAYVNTASGSLNMRETAGGRIIARLARGTAVTVLSQSGTWSRIAANGATGYVKSSYLSTTLPGSQAPVTSNSPNNGKIAVLSGGQPLRMQPSYSAGTITDIGTNAQVTIQSYGLEWSFVSFGGYTGYLPTAVLKITSQTATAQPKVTGYFPGNYTAYAKYAYSALRIYSEPGQSSENAKQIASLAAGARVYVIQRAATDDNQSWLQIQSGSVSGWVRSTDIALRTESGADVDANGTQAGGGTTAYVNTSSGSLNMRETAGGRVIAQLARGTTVTILSQSGSWARVSANGLTGYVMASYLSSTNTSGSGSQTSGAGMGSANSALDNTSARTNNSQTLRQQPDNASAAVATIPAGAAVTIRTYGTIWCSVSYGGMNGYMPTSTLSLTGASGGQNGTTVTSANYTAYVKYGNQQLRLYANAGDTSPQTSGSIAKDEQVYVRQRAVTADKTVWLQIQYGTITGWVREADLALYTASGSGSTGGTSSSAPAIGQGAAVNGGQSASSPTTDQIADWILQQQQQQQTTSSDVNQLLWQQIQQEQFQNQSPDSMDINQILWQQMQQNNGQ